MDDAQAYLDRWEECWADTTIHGTTKRQVAAMFAEGKPLEPFRYYQYGERVAHLDGCVEICSAGCGAWKRRAWFIVRSKRHSDLRSLISVQC